MELQMPNEPVPSVPLAEIFNSLTVQDVLRFKDERRREDLTLDFKTAPALFDDRNDRKNLAVAISGFANSMGGLIVWGVDARRGEDEIDCAQEIVPISNPDLFTSRLTSYAAAATSPPAEGVAHRLLEGTGGPFAVTFVPESTGGPHMAKLGEDRYYKRSGDQFRRMEHFDIADMLGRRPRPDLRLELTLDPDRGVGVAIRNDGRGAGRSPFLRLRPRGDLRPSQFGFDGNGAIGLKAWGREDSGWYLFGGDAGPVIHSGQRRPVTKLCYGPEFAGGVNPSAGVIVVEYELAAEDMQSVVATASVDFGDH
jgi:hypothetical protein